jgi:Holliday junction resolvase RusA-like endonuclease
MGAGGRWFTPDKTSRFERAAGQTAMAAIAMTRAAWPLDAAYEVELLVHFPDGRARDLDNVCKAVLDGCNRVLWKDDKQVTRLVLERFVDREAPRTEVLVRIR